MEKFEVNKTYSHEIYGGCGFDAWSRTLSFKVLAKTNTRIKVYSYADCKTHSYKLTYSPAHVDEWGNDYKATEWFKMHDVYMFAKYCKEN